MREIDLDHFKGMIEHQGKDLAPDDDWLPFLFLMKNRKVAIVGLPPVNTDSEKELAANMIRMTIRMTNPDSACYISTGWQGTSAQNRFMDKQGFDEAYKEGWIPKPSEDPDRREVVILVMMNRWSESGLCIGYIKRRKDRPPMIKRWKEIMADGNKSIGGRFGDAMTEGFASADTEGNLEVLNKWKAMRKVE